MNWLRSVADLAVDVTHALTYEVRALLDDWRGDR